MFKHIAIAAVGGIALLAGGAAHANTVNGTCGAVASAPTDLNTSISCSTFDETLGTLSSITLTVDGAITGTITLTLGGSAQSQTLDGTTSSQFFLNAADLTGFTFASPAFTASITSGPIVLAPNTSFTTATLDGNGTTGTLTNSALFANYESASPSTFSFGLSTVTGLLITGGGGFAGGNQTTFASADATVVYTYNSVTPPPPSTPEPATLTLFGAALAGLGWARRRNQGQK